MTAADVVGVVAFLVSVVSTYFLAKKSETGWALRIVGNLLWLVFGVCAVSIPNILSSSTFTILSIYGLGRWRRERLQRDLVCETCGKSR